MYLWRDRMRKFLLLQIAEKAKKAKILESAAVFVSRFQKKMEKITKKTKINKFLIIL